MLLNRCVSVRVSAYYVFSYTCLAVHLSIVSIYMYICLAVSLSIITSMIFITILNLFKHTHYIIMMFISILSLFKRTHYIKIIIMTILSLFKHIHYIIRIFIAISSTRHTAEAERTPFQFDPCEVLHAFFSIFQNLSACSKTFRRLRAWSVFTSAHTATRARLRQPYQLRARTKVVLVKVVS